MTGCGEITAGRENRRRPRGYDLDYRPQAKTRALLEKVDLILEEYRDYLPLTVRQIFYRLVGQYGYDKTEIAYARLAEALVRARRSKRIDFNVIRDDGVVTIRTDFYSSVEEFHDETARRIRRYRRDRQQGQGQYVELWCEAAGMLDQLARVADPFSVPVYSAGGFNSLTANYGVAQRALDRDVPTVILHVGDYDPSGESIFAAMTEDAAAFVEADRAIHTLRIEPVRVALTREQVSTYGLSTAPPKNSDSRAGSWSGETCQLEALSPSQLAEIVKNAIAGLISPDVYIKEIDIEQGERAGLLQLPRGGEER